MIDIALLVAFSTLMYVWFWKTKTNYWKSLNVPQVEPVGFPFGNNPFFCWEKLSGKSSMVFIKREVVMKL